jgi:hypothetical protein
MAMLLFASTEKKKTQTVSVLHSIVMLRQNVDVTVALDSIRRNETRKKGSPQKGSDGPQ